MNDVYLGKADLKYVWVKNDFTMILLFEASAFYIQTLRYNCNRERDKKHKDREEKEKLNL